MSEWDNTPPNWVGSDPCGGWDGIECTNSRITSMYFIFQSLISFEIATFSRSFFFDINFVATISDH